jgi:ABC-type multidrug transport system fused ATPase/permease subunit
MAEKRASRIAWIWGIWRERTGLIALLFALTLLSSLVAVTYPYLSKLLLDMLQRLLENPESQAAASRELRRLALLILAVGAAGFVAGLFPGIRASTNVLFDYIVRKKYFGAVLGKDYKFFSAFRSGDIVTRLTDDIYEAPKLSWFLCSGIFRAVESISKVAFCLTAMLLLDWRLTLLSLIPLPLMIVVFVLAQDRIYDTFRKNQEAISDINSQLEQSFSGVRIIKAYACESKYGRFFADALTRRFGTEMAVVKLETILQMVYMYIDNIMQIGVVFAGGYMAVRGDIGIGTFYAFYNYLGMLVYPILDIPNLFVSGKRAFVNIDRLEEMRGFPSKVRSAGLATLRSVDRLEGKGLSFQYEGRETPALEGVSFVLERGEKLAVIGPVGSGKTTLVKLLCGLIEPTSGEILVDGASLGGADPASLAALVGYVPQEALLFSGTIRENVAFGDPGEGRTICDGSYASAISMAQIEGEIAGFPAGGDTLLGQRQRVAIARAMARSPRLLLLDDITASLDAANEERLMRALDLWSRDLSCVVVSHRLSTLQYADKVLFLEGGRAVAFGVHEELLRESPPYRAFIAEHLALAP